MSFIKRISLIRVWNIINNKLFFSFLLQFAEALLLADACEWLADVPCNKEHCLRLTDQARVVPRLDTMEHRIRWLDNGVDYGTRNAQGQCHIDRYVHNRNNTKTHHKPRIWQDAGPAWVYHCISRMSSFRDCILGRLCIGYSFCNMDQRLDNIGSIVAYCWVFLFCNQHRTNPSFQIKIEWVLSYFSS